MNEPMNMNDPGFQGISIQCNKYSWSTYYDKALLQDVNLNSFYLEAYTFIRGLESTVSTQGEHSECWKKNAGDYGHSQKGHLEKGSRFGKGIKKDFTEKVVFKMGLQEQVGF